MSRNKKHKNTIQQRMFWKFETVAERKTLQIFLSYQWNWLTTLEPAKANIRFPFLTRKQNVWRWELWNRKTPRWKWRRKSCESSWKSFSQVCNQLAASVCWNLWKLIKKICFENWVNVKVNYLETTHWKLRSHKYWHDPPFRASSPHEINFS